VYKSQEKLKIFLPVINYWASYFSWSWFFQRSS